MKTVVAAATGVEFAPAFMGFNIKKLTYNVSNTA